MQKNKRPIGVFDSGVGGLTVLAELVKKYPNEDFYYVADQGHCPYGTKTSEQIAERVSKVARHLDGAFAKAIVIACNTASIQIAAARAVTDAPVISVIQPTAARAVSISKNGKIAVLATIATIKSGVYQRLLTEAGATPVPLAASEFVDFVENHDLNDPLGDEVVANKLQQIAGIDFDTLIHGCTHFSLLQPQMERALGRKINYVACGDPTADALGKILAERDLLEKDQSKGQIEIYTTGSVEGALSSMKWFKPEHKPVCHIDIE